MARKHASVINLQNNCHRLGLHLHQVLYQTKKLFNKAGVYYVKKDPVFNFTEKNKFYFLISKKNNISTPKKNISSKKTIICSRFHESLF